MKAKSAGTLASRCLLLLLIALGGLAAGCASVPAPVPSPPATAISLPVATTQAEVTEVPRAVQPTSRNVPTPLPSATAVPPSSSKPASVTAPAPSPPIVEVFSGESAYEFVRSLGSDIGSRPGGSDAASETAAYVQRQLELMGYKVTLQQYPVSSFREQSTRLAVTRPQLLDVGASALAYSGTGEVSGEVAYCGVGRPEDFPPSGVAGAVALMDRGEVTFQSKVDEAVSRGAAGVIIANNRGGELRGTLSGPSNVPVAGVLQSDGARLKALASRGEMAVTLRVDAVTTTRTGQNVVAVRPDFRPDRNKVILGAHYDSVSAGPGANDNGSGVATVLELARMTREQTYPYDLVFALFGDEEIGLVGSRNYVESLSPEERSRVLAMLNFDMVGVGTAMEFGGDKGLSDRATQIARSLGQKTQGISLEDNQSSDHASFESAGIPSVFLYRADDPNYHTARDTAEKVSTANLEAAGSVALRLLDDLAKR